MIQKTGFSINSAHESFEPVSSMGLPYDHDGVFGKEHFFAHIGPLPTSLDWVPGCKPSSLAVCDTTKHGGWRPRFFWTLQA